MAAATADREAKHSEGALKRYPVAASTVIYKGTLVGRNSSGYLVPMSDAAGLTFAGVAYEAAANGSGSNGDKHCRVIQGGEFQFVYAGGDAAQALVGSVVYAQDDQTVDEDVTLKVQSHAVGEIAEVISTTLVRIRIDGYATGPAGRVQRYPKRRVTAKTATYTVLPSQNGEAFTNEGAGGAIEFDLPAAVPGLEFIFQVQAAQALRIDPNGTETISLPSTGVAGAAGKYLEADAVGETVHLMCFKAGTWGCIGFTGTWTAEA